MTRKPVSAASTPSTTKTCALAAFRLVRRAQARITGVPVAFLQARDDIADAWRESRRFGRRA